MIENRETGAATQESFQWLRLPLTQVVGPLLLILTFAVGARGAIPFDLCIAGFLGFILSAHQKILGCVYALVCLIIASLLSHWFIPSHHWFRLGLEISCALSVFITALGFEGLSSWTSSKDLQLQRKESAVRNLEEELAKEQNFRTEQSIASSLKIEELQKSLEEIQTEKAALEMLNDVLRQNLVQYDSHQRSLEEKRSIELKKAAELVIECEGLKEEIARWKNADLILENRKLLDALNQARFAKEQTHLINETLVRLHAKESLRAKEAMDLLAKKEEEIEGLSRQEISFDEEAMERFYAMQKERDVLREQLGQAEEKIYDLRGIEAQYRQLKNQFEEKNHVLYETRSALFKADTQLQTLCLEKEEGGFHPDPFSSQLQEELTYLEQKASLLENENRNLEDLVTELMKPPVVLASSAIREAFPLKKKESSSKEGPSLEETLRDALLPKRKKKTKKVVQQDLLF